MIKYKLVCKNCDLTFDSWFSSSKEYEKLKKKVLLNCHQCDSTNVEKTIMAPRLLNKTLEHKENIDPSYNDIKKKIEDYQKFIKKNFKYVGKNFAYEARSIHYDNKKSDKGIYGTASEEDLIELKEEGIDAQMIPWLKDQKN